MGFVPPCIVPLHPVMMVRLSPTTMLSARAGGPRAAQDSVLTPGILMFLSAPVLAGGARAIIHSTSAS